MRAERPCSAAIASPNVSDRLPRSVASGNSALVSDQPYVIGAKEEGDFGYIQMGTPRSVDWVALDSTLKKIAVDSLECRLTEIIQPKGLNGETSQSFMVFGQVVGIHISEEIIRDGRIAMDLARPIARMGYMDYADGGTDVFQIARPTR